MEYTVVIADYINSLEYQVNELIQQGWKPQGGICVSSMSEYHTRFSYSQAMIKN